MPDRYLLDYKRYQVVAPCVVARHSSGQETYVYRDAMLPSDIDRGQLEHLVKLGMVTEIGAQA